MNEELRLKFIGTVAPLVQKYESPVSAAIRIAQACHETGYGASELANLANNLFGIKASPPWTGQKHIVLSPEWDKSGNKTYQRSEFRKYSSWEESIKDNASFYTSTDHRKNVYSGAINGRTYQEEAAGLTGPGRYATDPNYGQYLINVVEKYNLTQYNSKNNKTGEEEMVAKRTAASIAKQIWGTAIIEKSLWNGYAGRMAGNPKGVLIHNDAGRSNGKNYESWLRSARVGRGKAENGYAHYYSCRRYNARYEHTFNKAYHGGHSYPNAWLIGFEVVESLSANDSDFLKNEEVNLLQAAEDLLYYNLPINHDTVRLHRDYASTTCPHRSWDLHVGRNAVNNSANRYKLREYFIKRINYWAKVLKGELEIPTASTVGVEIVPNKTPQEKDNSNGYVLTPQTRRVGNWISNARTAPSTSGDIVRELGANYHFEVKGYINGQDVSGNDIWFVDAETGQYIHSGGTTNPKTQNLTHLTDDPHNKVEKSYTTVNEFLVGTSDIVIYDKPGDSSERVGVAKKGTRVNFTHVYQVDGAIWLGYMNGRGEQWFIRVADYDAYTREISNLRGQTKSELVLA